MSTATDDTCHADATVLIYHHFGQDQYPTTNVPTARFREQMAYLRENGYTVIPLDNLVRHLADKTPLPEKSVVITIDDGYKSIFTEAWPILKAFHYPFTVFLYGNALQKGYSNYLTWDQIHTMVSSGVDFQDHGYSHHRFGDRPDEMNESAYRNWIRDDLQTSREFFMDHLHKKPIFLALPYGEYNTIVLEEAKKLGYEAVFSQDPGSVSLDTDRFLIPREPILGNDWISMEHFSMILDRVDLPFTRIQPDLAPLENPFVTEIGVRLLSPERYVPESVGVYISELGWFKGQLRGSMLTVPIHKQLSRRSNRIAISAREKNSNSQAIRYWLIIQP